MVLILGLVLFCGVVLFLELILFLGWSYFWFWGGLKVVSTVTFDILALKYPLFRAGAGVHPESVWGPGSHATRVNAGAKGKHLRGAGILHSSLIAVPLTVCPGKVGTGMAGLLYEMKGSVLSPFSKKKKKNKQKKNGKAESSMQSKRLDWI